MKSTYIKYVPGKTINPSTGRYALVKGVECDVTRIDLEELDSGGISAKRIVFHLSNGQHRSILIMSGTEAQIAAAAEKPHATTDGEAIRGEIGVPSKPDENPR